MKVAVVEFSHFELIEGFARVLQPVCSHLTLIVNEWIAAELHSAGVARLANVSLEIILKREDELTRVESILSSVQPDLTIFGTIDGHYDGYARLVESLTGPKLLVIHNVNFWFMRAKRLHLFSVPRSPEHRSMLAMTQAADGLIVLDDTVKSYLASHYRPSRPVLGFTYALASPDRVNEEYDGLTLRVAVPGQIEFKRRNYGEVLDALESFEPGEIEMSFIGAPIGDYGREILERCKTMSDLGFAIEWSESYLDHPQFDSRMRSCSVILSPMRLHTSFAGVPETYGRSKVTGCVADIVRYQKPGIVPAAIPVPEQLRTSVLTYANSSTLGATLAKVQDVRVRAELTASARRNAEYWDTGNVRERFFTDLRKIGIAISVAGGTPEAGNVRTH